MASPDRDSYLWDILTAAGHIQQFTAGKELSDYKGDLVLASAVERQFEIMGEALNQLTTHFPELEGAITSARQIIAFRNRLIHAYASVDPEVVWATIEEDLPLLIEEVRGLLEEGE